MHPKSSKIAVSLPTDLLRAIERTRKTRRETRSAVVQEALRYWLDQQETRKLVEQYQEGYGRVPEGTGDEAKAGRWSSEAFASEDW